DGSAGPTGVVAGRTRHGPAGRHAGLDVVADRLPDADRDRVARADVDRVARADVDRGARLAHRVVGHRHGPGLLPPGCLRRVRAGVESGWSADATGLRQPPSALPAGPVLVAA